MGFPFWCICPSSIAQHGSITFGSARQFESRTDPPFEDNEKGSYESTDEQVSPFKRYSPGVSWDKGIKSERPRRCESPRAVHMQGTYPKVNIATRSVRWGRGPRGRAVSQ